MDQSCVTVTQQKEKKYKPFNQLKAFFNLVQKYRERLRFRKRLSKLLK